MIIGKINANEKKVKINTEIICTNCQTRVPGGIQTGEAYYKTEEFFNELEEFKKNYLCGKCRDKKRIKK